jgi:hypothetical protein
MKRLDLHGNVVARFTPQDMNVLIVSRRGTHREASRHGYDRTRFTQLESQLCIGGDDGSVEERRS